MTGGAGPAVRVGVVGFGAMGRRHLAALARADGMVPVAVADTSTHHHEPVAGVPVVDSLASLLDVGLDACVVATPSPDHAATAVQLAQAGLHVLVEKPLAMDASECAEVLAAFSQSTVVARVAHVERFNQAVIAARRCILSGALGQVRELVTHRAGGPPRRSDGGDALLDLGTHDVDLAGWLLGDAFAPASVHATPLGAAPVEEAARMTTETPGGVRTVHVVNARSAARVRTLEVRGDAGRLDADLLTGRLHSSVGGAVAIRSAHDPLTAQIEAFRDLVLGRLAPADPRGGASLAEGARAVALTREAMAAATPRR